MTDSEEEYEVDDKHRVGFAAEVACIIAIGCVAGLRGLTRMKKGVVSFVVVVVVCVRYACVKEERNKVNK